MPRKILVVDDNEINRLLLKNTLCEDYDILEAENGKVALEMIYRHCKELSAVLLDIVMPEMTGYEVLQAVRDDSRTSQIPVIMVTGSEDEASRVKALSFGANDFILKPFNPEIVRHCLKNNIAMRETASILNAIQRDKLTGLYTREAFFERVSAAVREKEPGFYILSSFDIDNFKLINDQYGAVEGDRILREIGKVVKEDMDEMGGIGARISADNFAALLPVASKGRSILRILQQNRMAFSDKKAIVFSVGRYVVSDLSLPSSAIYDRAYIAKQSIKGRYDEHIAYFDEAMLNSLIRDQQIIADMDKAIIEHQFEVWFQPQRNHSSGALVGAEALVRWRHPEKGLIPPSSFVPVFEQNGFVYQLDKYVWEETCRYLRKWIDEGRNPLPVSVNLSRYDIFRPDLLDVLGALTEKYAIPVELLRLEITESAFSKSTQMIVNIVKQLIERGFTIEIDDFGSGYSSLNTLKNVPALVLKLDMRFLEDDDGSGRGGNILESIVRMAKWLGMSVIAEGVEDKAQADYLASIGCSYIQGYLYSRPLPAAEYEDYCRNVGKEERLLVMETIANLDNNSFWDPKSMDTLIFNSYVGAACIFEYHNRRIELLRVNRKFADILGDSSMTVDDTLRLDWISCLAPESRALVRRGLEKSSRTGSEFTGEYLFNNISASLERIYLRSTMRVIATAGERMLVYCFSENLTAQRRAEENERAAAAQLRLLNDSIPGGLAVYAGSPNALHKIKLTYFNDGLCKLFGYSREEYEKLAASNPLSLVFPEDVGRMKAQINALVNSGVQMDYVYRAKIKGEGYKWINVQAAISEASGKELTVNAVFIDVTAQNEAMERLRISEEEYRLAMGLSKKTLSRYSIATKTLTVSDAVSSTYTHGTLLENVPEGEIEKGHVSPETASVYMEFYEGIQRGDSFGTMLYQRKTADGWRWIESDFTTIFSTDGTPVSAVISSVDVTARKMKEGVFEKWQRSLEGRDRKSFTLFCCDLNDVRSFDIKEGSLLSFDFANAGADFNERAKAYARQMVCEEDREKYVAFANADTLLAGYYRGILSRSLEYRELTPEGGAQKIRLSIELAEQVNSLGVAAFLLYEDTGEEKSGYGTHPCC